MTEDNKNMASEPQPDYEKAELDQLRAALSRSYSERFQMMTTLMRIAITLKKGKIVHKPYPKPDL